LVASQAISKSKSQSEVSAEKLVDPDDKSAGWLGRAIIDNLNEGVDLYSLHRLPNGPNYANLVHRSKGRLSRPNIGRN